MDPYPMSDDDDANGLEAGDVVAPVDERDDEARIEAPETETDAPDAEAPEVADAGPDANEDGDVEGDDDPDEEIELNFGGKTVKLSASQTAKEAAEEVQKFADETWRAHMKRSEEVAETRKALQARAEAVDKLQTLDDEAFNMFTQAKQYDTAIAQLEQRLQQTDRQANPDEYRFLSDDLIQYRQAAEQARNALAQREQQANQARAAEVQRIQAEGEAKVRKMVPKFDEAAVVDYVVSNYEGFDREQASKSWAINPAIAVMAHKAMQYDRMQGSARKAKPAPKQPAPVKSTSRRSGAARVDLANAPGKADDFHKARLAKLAKQRQR